jgi:hypothetical protein
MGWTHFHPHSFVTGDRGYTNAEAPSELNMRSEKGQTLAALLAAPVREFHYEYDFCDGWEHRIIVEATSEPVANWPYPLCVGGERACPPGRRRRRAWIRGIPQGDRGPQA